MRSSEHLKLCTILVQISPLDSALTGTLSVTPLESALTKKGGGGVTRSTLPDSSGLKGGFAEAEGVGDYGDGAEAHGRAG